MTKQGEGVGPHRDAAPVGLAEQDAPPAAARAAYGTAAYVPGAADVPAAARRRGSPRLWAALSCLLVAALAGAWLAGRSDEDGFLGVFGRYHSAAGGRPGGTELRPAAAGPVAFTSEHFFPADRAVATGSATAARTASREAADCTQVLRGKAVAVLRKAGCTDYIGATYTRQDGQVLTSVTVLRFKDATGARRAAQALAGRAVVAAVSFGLPDGSAQDATAVPPGRAAQLGRVAAVQRYVIVTSSAFRDGRRPTAVDARQLTAATRSLAYAAGSEFSWL